MSDNMNLITADMGATTEATATDVETTTVEETVDWKAEAEKAKADAEKWKAMSRKNEDNFKSASSKLSEYEKANLTDSEKILAEATEAGRNAALSEMLNERAQDKLESAAAKAGVELDSILGDLNMGRFVADGSVNTDAINDFVNRFADVGNSRKQDKGKTASELGVGPQGTRPQQLTQADLKGMSPKAILEAEKAGQLDKLLKK